MNKPVNKAVLDASALLALINGEPGAEIVSRTLPDAVVSAVNLAEVISKLTDYGHSDSEIDEVVAGLGLNVVPFDAAQARAVGILHRSSRARGLSLADRACLALADTLGGSALSTDRIWGSLDIGVDVRLIRGE